MEVCILSICTLNKKTREFDITVEKESSVLDLKKMLEPKLSVAVCDQVVKYNDRVIANSKTMSELYVRPKERFTVEFPTACEMESLRRVIKAMEEFVKTVCKGFEENMDIGRETDVFQIYGLYSTLYGCLESCGNTLFMPWSCASALANRHYFRQEAGLDMLSTIYKFSRKTYQYLYEDYLELVDLNFHQELLEYLCLVSIWNYSEVQEDRRMVVDKIGLDTFIQSLISLPSDGSIVNNANEAVVGCIVQYVEMPDIQEKFCKSSEALKRLLTITTNARTTYHQEVAVNALYCCSSNSNAVVDLVGNKIHLAVMDMTRPILEEKSATTLTVAMQYFFCLFLANIRTLSQRNALSDQEKEDIDKILERFLALHYPSEIGDYEREHHYVWITLVPFMHLALSCDMPIKAISSSVALPQKPSEKSQYTFSAAAKIALFSLCHLCKRNPNQYLFKKENLIDYLVCICWFAKNWKKHVYLVPEMNEFEKVEPPKLQSIASVYLAKCYGCPLEFGP